MEPVARQSFNKAFSESAYQKLKAQFEVDFPGELDFRVGESPVFIPKALEEKLVEACESIVDIIAAKDFRVKTDRAIPSEQAVPGENEHTSFLAIDFAITRDTDGRFSPQLIELQGFPSVFGYQAYLSDQFRKLFRATDDFTYKFPKVLPKDEFEIYMSEFGKFLLGGHAPENVVLLEIYPEKQKTRIDFAITQKLFGVRPVCYTKIIKEGRALFYEEDNRKVPIKRIYNRLILDELLGYGELKSQYKFSDEVDVEWVGHPNWFFRISKFMLPFLKSPFVPEAHYLSDFADNFPSDLENYVLKPLFSFAGSGVQLKVTEAILREIRDPENYILQRKVVYEPSILTPDGSKVKTEIRMLYIWPDAAVRPQLFTALSRLSRGEMIGVRFNKDFTWVGGSAVFFQ